MIISRDDSILLIVDYQDSFSGCFSEEHIIKIGKVVSFLLRTANHCHVPLLGTCLRTNSVSPAPISALSSVDPTCLTARSVANPWDDENFSEKVAALGRRHIVLIGISVETSITLTALGALERGYDVFLVSDACLAHTEQSEAAALSRLTQAGCVLLNWRQVAIEWHRHDADTSLLRRIFRARL